MTRTIADVRAEIAHTRQELHDTAAALAARADLHAHLKQATVETAARIAESAAEAGEHVVARVRAWRRRDRPSTARPPGRR